MKRAILPATCLATLAVAQAASAQTCTGQHNGNNGTVCCKPIGPDVIVGDLQEVANFTAVGAIDAFSFGTVSCNVGNANCSWSANDNGHPVVGQNMFKYKNAGGYAKFEQLGQSFLKHTFCTLAQNTCGCTCSVAQGSCSGGPEVLYIGCSDPYTAGRNAAQNIATVGSFGGVGPKNQVNAATGSYPFPPSAAGGTTNAVFRRLQCKIADLEITDGGAGQAGINVRYFGECEYVCAQDASNAVDNNNCSYREVAMSGGPTNFTIALAAGKVTQREQPGIRAWQDIDPTVKETDVQIASDGLMIVSTKATSLGGTQWHYEYAVQNVNSDRSGQSFTVPLPAGAVLTNIGFHDVDYHDGDGVGNVNYDGTDWTPTVGASSITWATQTFAQNANANALRWGTMYNFRFDCNLPPVSGNVTIGLFKAGAPGSVTAASTIPSLDCNHNNVADATDIANATSQDTNNNGIPDECEAPPNPCHQADFVQNNVIDIDDLVVVITAWGPCPGPCPRYCPGDATHDCNVNIDDLVMVITAWGPCN